MHNYIHYHIRIWIFFNSLGAKLLIFIHKTFIRQKYLEPFCDHYLVFIQGTYADKYFGLEDELQYNS